MLENVYLWIGADQSSNVNIVLNLRLRSRLLYNCFVVARTLDAVT